MKYFENYCIRDYIFLKNLVYVRHFYIVERLDELKNLLQKIAVEDKPKIRILGSGTNILINDNKILDLIVIKLSGEFNTIKIDKENNIFLGYAGVLLQSFITKLLVNKISGMEVLAGIPGTIGGAVFGNAGTKYGEISKFIRRVFLLDYSGNEKIIDVNEKNLKNYFGYRENFFFKNFIIYKIEFCNFLYNSSDSINFYKKFFCEKIKSQPYEYKSLGCIFKNPKVGVCAGELIDKLGLKNYKMRSIFISDKHANFFIADKNVKFDDFLELINIVKYKIYERFKLNLELEIKIWE